MLGTAEGANPSFNEMPPIYTGCTFSGCSFDINVNYYGYGGFGNYKPAMHKPHHKPVVQKPQTGFEKPAQEPQNNQGSYDSAYSAPMYRILQEQKGLKLSGIYEKDVRTVTKKSFKYLKKTNELFKRLWKYKSWRWLLKHYMWHRTEIELREKRPLTYGEMDWIIKDYFWTALSPINYVPRYRRGMNMGGAASAAAHGMKAAVPFMG